MCPVKTCMEGTMSKDFHSGLSNSFFFFVYIKLKLNKISETCLPSLGSSPNTYKDYNVGIKYQVRNFNSENNK